MSRARSVARAPLIAPQPALVHHYDPQGAIENVGDALGVVSARVKGDFPRFKDGEIKQGLVEQGGERVSGGRPENSVRRKAATGLPPSLHLSHNLGFGPVQLVPEDRRSVSRR